MKGCILKSDNTLKREGRGSYDYRTDVQNNVLIIKWFDNKCVHIITTYKHVEPVEKIKRWSTKDKKFIDVDRPAPIAEYNTHMGGVDLSDMLVSLYRTDIKSRRFYLRIFFYLVDLTIVNAWLSSAC